MRIVVLPPRGVLFAADSPWNSLLAGLRACGHEVDGYGQFASRPEALVTLNDQPEARRLQRSFSIPEGRSALVLLEPRVTAPQMYTKRVVTRYAIRFAASPSWAAAIGARPFLWPQKIVPGPTLEPCHKFDATMINAEKRSAVEGSLYGLRRAVIREMDERGMNLAVYGPGWDSHPSARLRQGFRAAAKAVAAGIPPHLAEAMSGLVVRPRNWQGRVQDKDVAFSTAPASVIIENSADYVSEKLVDAIAAGVVPIYVGPPLPEFGLSSDLAITCRPAVDDVVSSMTRLTPGRRSEVLEAGNEWLQSSACQHHEIRHVLRTLGCSLGHALNHS